MAVDGWKDKLSAVNLPATIGSQATKLAIKAGVVLAVGYFIKKAYNKYVHNKAVDKVGEKLESQQATAIRAAINPSGFRWLWWVEIPHKDALYDTAKKIKDFKTVIQEYRKLYDGDDLEADVRTRLPGEEYNRFLNTINFNDSANAQQKSSVNFAKGRVAITKGQANIRKTPRAAGSPTKDKLLIFGRSNIITTIDKGIAVGVVTGKTHFDEKAEPSGVLFIEVNVLKSKSDPKNAFTAWVAGSQIDTKSAEEYKTKPSPSLSITQSQFDEASSSLSGHEVALDKSVVATTTAAIMDEKFRIIKTAPAGLILGIPLMELHTKDQSYVKFLTIQHLERWVNKKQVNILQR